MFWNNIFPFVIPPKGGIHAILPQRPAWIFLRQVSLDPGLRRDDDF